MFAVSTLELNANRSRITVGLVLLCCVCFTGIAIADTSADIDAYRLRLEKINEEHSAYAAPLFEEYFGLGVALQNDGQHDEALKSFRQAVHIKRINAGLYSLEIEPIVQRMLLSYVKLKRWDKLSSQMLQLANAVEAQPVSVQLHYLPLYEKIVKWYLWAYRERLGKGYMSNLNRAGQLSDRAIVLLRSVTPSNSRQLRNFYRHRINIVYERAELEKEMIEKARKEEALRRPHGSYFDVPRTQLNKYYQRGLTMINSDRLVLQQDSDASLHQRVELLARLADWHVIFYRSNTAAIAYKAAWQLLQDEGDYEQRQQIYGHVFQRPLYLETEDSRYQNFLPGDKRALGFVDLDVSFSKRGRVERSRVVQAVPDMMQNKHYFSSAINRMSFRPAIDNGNVRGARNVRYRHSYHYIDNKVTDSEKNAAKPASASSTEDGSNDFAGTSNNGETTSDN